MFLVAMASWALAGDPLYNPKPVSRGETAPTNDGAVWVKESNWTAAAKDTLTGSWLGFPQRVLCFGDNADTDGNEFLKFGQRENSDTTGTTAEVQGAGEYIPYNALCVAPYGVVSGAAIGVETCSVRVYTTNYDSAGVVLRWQHIFTGPPGFTAPDSTFELDAGDVVAVYIGTTGNVKNPHIYFPIVERR